MAARRILIGAVAGAHGVRGEVLIKSYAAEPERIAGYGPLYDETGNRQFQIAVRRLTGRGVIARIEGVASRSEAEALKGMRLYVDRERLPATEAGEYYHADLVGLLAVSPAGEVMGEVVAVQNYGAGDLIEIRLAGGGETELVPFTDAFVPRVDLAAGRMTVALPIEVSARDETASTLSAGGTARRQT
ncbi:MAG TPA: ribosome maturation factor RimM [Hyphomicrobiaceae bacterium]|nr:ribosome maturation factor RimM [Hyphomicrobiaceae bacterium]